MIRLASKIYMNGTVIKKILAFLKVQKILFNFCFSKQILQEINVSLLFFVAQCL